MIHSALQQRIYNYLEPTIIAAGMSAGSIIFSYQDGTAPVGNYIILDVQEGGDDMPPEVLNTYTETGNPEINNKEHIVYRSKVTVGVDIRGDEVMSKARIIKAWLYSTDIVELARSNFLGFVRFSPTRLIPVTLEQATEQRAIFNIELNYTEVETIVVGTIGQVTVIGHDEEGNLIVDETISEPGFVAP